MPSLWAFFLTIDREYLFVTWLWLAEAEVESGSLIRHAFGPYMATVFLYDAFHQREAYACALKFAEAMQSVEGTKELTVHFHVKTCAIVSYREYVVPMDLFTAYHDERMLPLGGVFNGIAEQVYDHLLHHRGIGRAYGQCAKFNKGMVRLGDLEVFPYLCE